MQLIETPYVDLKNLGNFAIALCGGGAAGRWQAGLLVALAQAGIVQQAKLICGTSVGSLNAALFAKYGAIRPYETDNKSNIPHPFEDAIAIWEDIKSNKDIYLGRLDWYRFLGAFTGAKSILDRTPLKKRLNNIFGDTTFGDVYSSLQTHLSIGTGNLNTKRVEFLNSWDPQYKHIKLSTGLAASSGIPLAFDSTEISFPNRKTSQWFIDGGIGANNPFVAIDEYNEAFPTQKIEKVLIIYCYPEDVADLGVGLGEQDTNKYESFKDAAIGTLPTIMNSQEQILEKFVDIIVKLNGPDVLAMWPNTVPCDTLDFGKTSILQDGYN